MRSYDAETDRRKEFSKPDSSMSPDETRTSSRSDRAVRASPVAREAIEDIILDVSCGRVGYRTRSALDVGIEDDEGCELIGCEVEGSD